MGEPRIINQGGFGCIFFPSVHCEKPNKTDDDKHVSKLVMNDFTSSNEIQIGKMIKDMIPFYFLYYVPILHHCPASLAKINKNEIKKCKIIEDAENDKFLLLKMKYIKNKKFNDYLFQNTSKRHFLNIIFDTYSYFIFSLEQLTSLGIVHFDFKFDNTLIDLKTELPLIIDFGLSIPIEKMMDSRSYKSYFYGYHPTYSIWPLEVHVLNYVINEKETLDKADVWSIINTYVDNCSAFTIFSSHFISQYKNSCYYFLSQFVGASQNMIIETCMKYWKTWDNYALSITYLNVIKFISKRGFTSNEFLLQFSQILLYNLHPNPSRRSDYETTRYKYKSIFYTKIDIESYNLLIQNFDIPRFKEQSILLQKSLSR